MLCFFVCFLLASHFFVSLIKFFSFFFKFHLFPFDFFFIFLLVLWHFLFFFIFDVDFSSFLPYDIIYSEEGSSFSKLKNPWWWFLYSKSPADGSFTVGASADGSSTTVGAPSDGPSTVGAPGKGSSVVGAPISIWAGSPNRGVLCGASYKENFPFCDVSLQRESLIPQLEGSDPSPKSKPIFHGSNKSTT